MIEYDYNTLVRFWSKVDIRGPDECWEWQAARTNNGYGRFRLSRPRIVVRAHVFSYVITKGDTNSLCVCHFCDNPACCNPKHLWLGTHIDNMRDCVIKKRNVSGFTNVKPKGELHPRANLTEKDVYDIRELIAKGYNNKEIALLYPVTHSMVSCIKHGKAWTHI